MNEALGITTDILDAYFVGLDTLIFPTKFVVGRKFVGSEAGIQYIRRR